MKDRREVIIEAGLKALREHGYAGFTQPRVAAFAGLRQSHLTYYHPTRLDLLGAIGRAAVDRQLAAVRHGITRVDGEVHHHLFELVDVHLHRPQIAAMHDLQRHLLTQQAPQQHRQLAAVGAMLAGLSSSDQAAHAIAELVLRRENTRVLMALAQAADEERALCDLFRELADGIVAHVGDFLRRVGTPEAEVEERARMLHALSVGLSVVSLATDRPDGKQRAAGILSTTLQLIASGAGRTPRARRNHSSQNSGGKA